MKLLEIVYNLWMICACKCKHKKLHLSMSAHCNQRTRFEGENYIWNKVVLSNTCVGRGTYIGPYSSLVNCKIGRYCSIASNVSLIKGRHPINFVSTSPAFFSLRKQNGTTYVKRQKFDEDDKLTIIKNDVWIGEDVKIMSGVTINDGAIIGARALVLKDVPPYAVVAGIPAKIIKYRFDESTIEDLLKTKWWNKSQAWLKENADLFNNVQDVLDALKSEK